MTLRRSFQLGELDATSSQWIFINLQLNSNDPIETRLVRKDSPPALKSHIHIDCTPFAPSASACPPLFSPKPAQRPACETVIPAKRPLRHRHPPDIMLSSVHLVTAWLGLAAVASALHFNVTTIAATNGSSTLECWQLKSNLTTSSEAGTTGSLLTALGDVSEMSYTVLPAGFDGGRHNAPSVQ